jgi:uncharacterized protein (TIGR00730 family)
MRASVIRSLCVFCGSAEGHNPEHMASARRLGAILARQRVTLVYGGGNVGLMGALAEGALEGGGRVVGVIPEHLVRWEVAHAGVSELVVVDSMHTRKARMFEMADAFAVLPGGLGTLDETFEILTWKQLHLHAKPVAIVDQGGFWRPLLALVDHMIEGGFVRPEHRDLFLAVPDVEALLPALAQKITEAPALSKLF